MKLNKYDKEMIEKASNIADIYQQIEGVSTIQSGLISRKEQIKDNCEMRDTAYRIADEEDSIFIVTCNKTTMTKILDALINECEDNIRKYTDNLKHEMYELISYSSDDDE